jgi:hypothetical protein
MGFTEPDSAPQAPPQMPQASTPGPAPVPYGGGEQAPEPPQYGVMPIGDAGGATGLVTAGYPGGLSPSALAAPNVNPYEAGSPDPIFTGGDADAGGRDTAAGSVDQAVTNAEARFGELRGDTYGQGSTIGDVMSFPSSPLDPGAGAGLTDPEGHYYDPPRSYEGNEPQ